MPWTCEQTEDLGFFFIKYIFSGFALMSSYVKVYLRNIYPYMFEEGIR